VDNLILGDSTVVIKTFANEQFDTVFTSPPYNRKRDDKYASFTDIYDDYFDFLVESIEQCLRVCKGNVFYNVQKNFYNRVELYKLFGHFAEQIIETIIWNKSNPTPAGGDAVTNAYEYILVLSNNNTALKGNDTYTKNHFCTPVYSENPYKEQHRAVMHPKAVEFILRSFCHPNQNVLDPFMGTGTTGVVCKQFGMEFTGIELVEEYYNISKQQLSNYTQAFLL
jgi:DNA modification methylase|tara:strand:+ start:3615 stop:4286 length:672 start_codon:yes stop_codon:yes gene_type:complete